MVNIDSANKQPIASFLRQLGAWAAVGYATVSGITANTGWGAKNTVLALVGGLLLSVEHFVADPSTGSPPPPGGTLG